MRCFISLNLKVSTLGILGICNIFIQKYYIPMLRGNPYHHKTIHELHTPTSNICPCGVARQRKNAQQADQHEQPNNSQQLGLSYLLLRHGKAEVCNDGFQLDSHCRLDLWPREHLNEGIGEKHKLGISQTQTLGLRAKIMERGN